MTTKQNIYTITSVLLNKHHIFEVTLLPFCRSNGALELDKHLEALIISRHEVFRVDLDEADSLMHSSILHFIIQV